MAYTNNSIAFRLPLTTVLKRSKSVWNLLIEANPTVETSYLLTAKRMRRGSLTHYARE